MFLVSCFETETEKLEPIVSKQMFLADLWVVDNESVVASFAVVYESVVDYFSAPNRQVF